VVSAGSATFFANRMKQLERGQVGLKASPLP
jgi:hypothetical protein